MPSLRKAIVDYLGFRADSTTREVAPVNGCRRWEVVGNPRLYIGGVRVPYRVGNWIWRGGVYRRVEEQAE